VVAACGGEAPETGAPTGDFCEEVMASVDPWLAGARDGWSPPATGEGRYGGTAVLADRADFSGGLGSFGEVTDMSAQHQTFVNHMTLVRYDEQLEPEPYLAESWEISEDGTELTFRLRDDVHWHDGERTTAYDVAFTFERMKDPTSGYRNAPYWDLYLDPSEGMQVVDSFTISFRTERPVPEMLDAWRAAPIMPRHLLGDVPVESLAQHPYNSRCPVGNGPFVFREHRTGERWVFEANPAFPEALGGRPYLDRYVYRVIPEGTVRMAELLTGGIHVYPGVNPNEADDVVEAEDAELQVFDYRAVDFVAWNTRREPLADERVRRALTHALDRERVVEALLQGYGRVAYGSLPPFHWAFEPDHTGLEHDPERARELLEEAGWRDRDGDGVRENEAGDELSLTVRTNAESPLRVDLAQILQAELAEVGVEVDIAIDELGTVVAMVVNPESRDFDGLIIGFTQDFKIDDTTLFHSREVDAQYAFSGLRSVEVDALLDSLRVERDREVARGLFARYQDALVAEQPFTFVYFPHRLVGVSTSLNDAPMDVRGTLFAVRDWWLDPGAREAR